MGREWAGWVVVSWVGNGQGGWLYRGYGMGRVGGCIMGREWVGWVVVSWVGNGQGGWLYHG